MNDEKLKVAIETLRQCRGVRRLKLLTDDEKRLLLGVEAEVERRVILGLCPSLNLGVREAVDRRFTVAMVIQTSEFPYPHHPYMRVMLDDMVVGEQVSARGRVSELRKLPGNMLLWDDFVVYRSRLPRDLEGRRRMRLVYLPRPFPALHDLAEVRDEVLGVPSAEGDQLLKSLLGETSNEPTLGTSLIGFLLR